MHERIADKFYACLKQRAESIKVGDPLAEDCRLGPVVAEHQLAKIMDFIKVRGASLLLLPPRILLITAQLETGNALPIGVSPSGSDIEHLWHQ